MHGGMGAVRGCRWVQVGGFVGPPIHSIMTHAWHSDAPPAGRWVLQSRWVRAPCRPAALELTSSTLPGVQCPSAASGWPWHAIAPRQ